LRRLLLLTLLGEARKVSSYRATPGRQSSNNDKNTNKTKPQQSENNMPPTRIFHAAHGPPCLKKRMEYARWRCLF
jgi:hypothetical protein